MSICWFLYWNLNVLPEKQSHKYDWLLFNPTLNILTQTESEATSLTGPIVLSPEGGHSRDDDKIKTRLNIFSLYL